MYKLTMCVANIAHKPWYRNWNNRSAVYTFNDIEELIGFMWDNIPMRYREVEIIRENDINQKNGRLACTLWYEVVKGENQMTEYTSF